VFDFMIGAIFFDVEIPDPLFELIGKYGVGIINALAFNISVDAISNSYSPEQRASAYAFCNISFGPCSVRTMLCYAMLCYAMLCYTTLYCAT
jgi:hypothetical protein